MTVSLRELAKLGPSECGHFLAMVLLGGLVMIALDMWAASALWTFASLLMLWWDHDERAERDAQASMAEEVP
jgi:hypothetical protein